MTDFEYDAMQKKRIAAGDRHRKRGGKSKYCGLPSDHMTQAQWKKKNGEVIVMNLTEAMPWRQFRSMPADLQVEYVNKCVERFGCSMSDFARVFGVSAQTVRAYFKELRVADRFPRGRSKRPVPEEEFERWLGHNDLEPVIEETTPVVPAAPAASPAFWPTQAVRSATHLEFAWEHPVDLPQIFTLVAQCIGDGPCTLHMSIDKR